MTTRRYVWRDGRWVDRAELAPRGSQGGIHQAPAVIRDGLNDLRHPATGEIVDSKARFRRITRDSGCEEVGTSEMKPGAPPRISANDDVGRAIRMVKEGYRPEVQRSALPPGFTAGYFGGDE